MLSASIQPKVKCKKLSLSWVCKIVIQWKVEFQLSAKSWIYFLDFAFYHYPCTTAGGQIVPGGTCPVVIVNFFPQEVLLHFIQLLNVKYKRTDALSLWHQQ